MSPGTSSERSKEIGTPKYGTEIEKTYTTVEKLLEVQCGKV